MRTLTFNLTNPAAHLLLVAAAIALALLIAQLAVQPPTGDMVLLAALMASSGLSATLLGHAAISLARRLRVASLAVRFATVSALGSVLALTSILIVAQLMFISRHDMSLLLGLLILSLAVALPLGLAAAASLATSISDLARGASQMAAGDLSVRVPIHGSDELATLAETFNRMADNLETSNRRRVELEQARRSFVAAVSHDLRTPLASLRAAAEALSDGVVSDPPTVSRYLTSIQAEAERLGGLIDDLFELSLIDAGNLRLELEPTCLGDLISDTVKSMAHQARLKRIRLSGQAPADLAPVLADPHKLQRVILNLVQNAIRHTPDDGSVSLEAEQIEEAVAVSVTDTCGGIQPKEIPHLFDPFFRGDPSRHRDGSGAGLGLSIAKGIVEAHGGSIWVDDSPSNGCRFSFTLPNSNTLA